MYLSWHKLVQFLFIFRLDWSVVASPMLSAFVVVHIVCVLLWFATSCTCHWVMCPPKLLALFCILLQTSHAVILPWLTKQGGCSDGQYLLGVFKLGNLQLFQFIWSWEILKMSFGKSCFLLGEFGNIFVKFWNNLGKTFCWETLKWFFVSISFLKNFSWENPIVGDVLDQISWEIFLQMLGKMLLWANLFGIFAKILNCLLGKNLFGNMVEPLESVILGKLW